MKRQILCLDCARSLFSLELGLGEKQVQKGGIAIQSYLCDFCGKTIPVKSKCVADSLMAAGMGYFEWEPGYLHSINSFKRRIG